jgi:Protein of unknown function (DUF4058)
MPLRDHFHPPLDNYTSWEGFHGMWPGVIVQYLNQKLPQRYAAEPRVHSGSYVEIDIAAFEVEDATASHSWPGDANGGVATAVWAPARPTLEVETGLPAADEYEVRVFDTKRGRRLVAAVEIVSPANKDRPEHRRVFVAKCAALLRQGVSVCVVDLVTVRDFNLYADLLDLLGQGDATRERPPLYAASCRWRVRGGVGLLEAWSHPLALGQPLPTLPLWLSDDLAVPLELEQTYEQTCRDLRIR